MVRDESLILGEAHRTLDERYRLSIPPELSQGLGGEQARCVLAKERTGCLSLWKRADWQETFEAGLNVIEGKLRAGKFATRSEELQRLGRLLSTRHANVTLAGRGRLLLPEGFREFLRVEPNANVVLVGAAVCLEIWNPAAWIEYLEQRMPKFRGLFDRLTS